MDTTELATRFDMLVVAHLLAILLLIICILTAISAYRSFKQTADLLWIVAFLIFILVQTGYIWEALRLKDSIRLLNKDVVDTFAETMRLRLPFATFNVLGTMVLVLAFRARRSLF